MTMDEQKVPLHELKKRAIAYYSENKVPQNIEKLLNNMFIEDPNDLYGYMAEYFAGLAKDTVISKVTCKRGLSPQAHYNLTVSIHCIKNGVDQPLCEVESFIDDRPIKQPTRLKSAAVVKQVNQSKKDSKSKLLAKKDGSMNESFHAGTPVAEPVVSDTSLTGFNFEKFVGYVRDDFVPLVECEKLVENNQKIADGGLKSHADSLCQKVRERRNSLAVEASVSAEEVVSEVIVDNSAASDDASTSGGTTEIKSACLFISMAIAEAAAKVANLSIYDYLSRNYEPNVAVQDCPLPALSLLSCGVESPGKCNVLKGIMAVPKPDIDQTQGISTIMKVYNALETSLNSKTGQSCLARHSNGSFMPSMEKPDMAFDLLDSVCQSLDLQMKETFDIIIHVAADEFYDEDKKRYEYCTGLHKTADDLIAVYEGWIDSYPIIAIIDGLASKDSDNWSKMTSQLGHKCFVIADQFPGTSRTDTVNRFNDESFSGVVTRPSSGLTTVTEMVNDMLQINGAVRTSVGCLNWSDANSSTFAVDLAFYTGCDFICYGAPCNSERINNINRHIKLYNTIWSEGATRKPHTFDERIASRKIEQEKNEELVNMEVADQ